MKTPIFLQAEWRHLLMLNYRVNPALLAPLVPCGTELDFFQGQTFLSLVGFRFLRTRVFGMRFPFHADFEEVNLRFYVRRRTAEGWRRGVVFIRELVPRRAIAFIARTFYGEPYLALPMRHQLRVSDSGIEVEYGWRRNGRWETIRAAGEGESREIEPGSEAEFITEHYWGYTSCGAGCNEYEVEHPRWRAWPAISAECHADIGSLYGPQFAGPLSGKPTSAFIAEGSPIVVRGKSALGPAKTKEDSVPN